ncbi:MAG: hypothetical protein HYV60_16750 [Planctomycetia bacterium]|nr:hypothetical protein [Planctomycetia bacterium]
MRSFLPHILFSLTCVALPIAAEGDGVDFEKQIRPLLIARCGECHGPEDQQGGLRLDARHTALKGGDSGAVIVPGESGESELLRRVTSSDEDERMPPEGEPLREAEIVLLTHWIDGGAKWPETEYDRQAKIDPRLEHWAFQPLWTEEGGRLNEEVKRERSSIFCRGRSPHTDSPTVVRYAGAAADDRRGEQLQR